MELTLRVGDIELEQTLELRGDPRIEMTAQDYRQQIGALMALREMASDLNEAINLVESLRSQLESIQEAARASRPVDGGDLSGALAAAIDSLGAVSATYLRRPPPRMNYRQRPRVSEEIRSLTRAIGGVEARPTEPQLTRVEGLRDESREALAALDRVLDRMIRPLNDRLGEYPRIMVPARGGGESVSGER